MLNGQIRFVKSKNINNLPYWDENLPKSVNELGGMEELVRSVPARNLWLICKQFNVLPNDPLITNMSYPIREFIIHSMLLDAEEAKMAERGEKADERAVDKTQDDSVFEQGGRSLVEDDDDPDDIYRQVKAQTKDKEYDIMLDSKIEAAVHEHEMKLDNIKRQQELAIKNMSEDTKRALGIKD